ncbi:hypothetical protein OIO90_005991 [Microbotryomycetes sp. JL221]|nr:hypothetical protein OIO90_005991 [Microbotryomycetes sp. JL221]
MPAKRLFGPNARIAVCLWYLLISLFDCATALQLGHEQSLHEVFQNKKDWAGPEGAAESPHQAIAVGPAAVTASYNKCPMFKQQTIDIQTYVVVPYADSDLISVGYIKPSDIRALIDDANKASLFANMRTYTLIYATGFTLNPIKYLPFSKPGDISKLLSLGDDPDENIDTLDKLVVERVRGPFEHRPKTAQRQFYIYLPPFLGDSFYGLTATPRKSGFSSDGIFLVGSLVNYPAVLMQQIGHWSGLRSIYYGGCTDHRGRQLDGTTPHRATKQVKTAGPTLGKP